jgi:hypothetical protein
MKNVLVRDLSLAFALATVMLALPQAAQPLPPDKSADVYEAVVLYQIKSWDLTADSYCVKINNRDADGALLRHLQSPRVKPASACKKHRERGLPLMTVIDKKTKRASVIFDLEAVRWKSETEAEIDGGYVCASLCMAGGVYHAVFDQSGWHVIHFDAQVMS